MVKWALAGLTVQGVHRLLEVRKHLVRYWPAAQGDESQRLQALPSSQYPSEQATLQLFGSPGSPGLVKALPARRFVQDVHWLSASLLQSARYFPTGQGPELHGRHEPEDRKKSDAHTHSHFAWSPSAE